MSRTIRRVVVFCASSPGVDPALARASYDVGRALADRGIGLVYGGGGHGLMREVSQGALDAGLTSRLGAAFGDKLHGDSGATGP